MSSKSPAIKRILKEASELASQPSADYHAAPLENDLFEWHFTLRGPPAPSSFDNGVYHGRIVLPPAYPLKPPSFRFLTPTGRFEVNREICLSISGHHEETWQPAWGIRTALVAIRSFMDTDARGQLGGMDASDEVRRRLAAQSRGWKCPVCLKTNEEVIREVEESVKEAGGEAQPDHVPEELRLAYKDDLDKVQPSSQQPAAAAASSAPAPASDPSMRMQPLESTSAQPVVPPHAVASSTTSRVVAPAPAPSRTASTVATQSQAQLAQQPLRGPQTDGAPAWIDKAIWGVVAAIGLLLWQRFFL